MFIMDLADNLHFSVTQEGQTLADLITLTGRGRMLDFIRRMKDNEIDVSSGMYPGWQQIPVKS